MHSWVVVAVAPTIFAKNNSAQKEGKIPDFDKDFIRNMKTQNLNELGREVRNLTRATLRVDEDMRG
ncbi:MAG: hypothetical protein A6F71_10725 [Cycloclasticus sp. symbiont of Poecilosclerida sp. M]|nr:MAG: hypothetical protein A6F71_10725 [Cycloclasticus sp. symbiont of Poecilosclerida sp. M]